MKAKYLLAAALVSTVVFTIGSAGTAMADSAQDCPDQSACLYYNSDLGGASAIDNGDDIADYGTWKFYYTQSGTGGQNGYLQYVKNNAASISSGNDPGGYRVYYNSNYAGVYQTIGGNSWANLNSQLKNENASGRHL
ncbi:peptidase inhibitor family I36 protein [Streptomyces sp. HC307]|uniref:peptidase inhibitor family I36 protein n=1 Tax=Streptomyces flavusporus TaxID=3385496 RepID=UPI0039170E7B